MRRTQFFHFVFGLILLSGCSPALFAPAPEAARPADVQIPTGWATHSSQRCEYAVSYPPDIQVRDQSPYGATFGFKLADPQAGARNFIYVSVITPEIQQMVAGGAYNHEVYNYDPVAAEALLGMQVGESRSLAATPDLASAFTYRRQPDTTIGGLTARTYENSQPWEFPPGTTEIRYYVSVDPCTYLIGGHIDTQGSSQPGAISADLFHQIIATVQLIP